MLTNTDIISASFSKKPLPSHQRRKLNPNPKRKSNYSCAHKLFQQNEFRNRTKQKKKSHWTQYRHQIKNCIKRRRCRYLLCEGFLGNLVVPVKDVETCKRRRSSPREERRQPHSQNVTHPSLLSPPFLSFLYSEFKTKKTLRCPSTSKTTPSQAKLDPQRRRFGLSHLRVTVAIFVPHNVEYI